MSLLPAAASRPHTDALTAALAGAGLATGRGQEPDGAGWQAEPGASDFVPYAVVYPSPGMPDGDLADPNEYLDYAAQITCVAGSSEGAEAAADIAKTLVGQRLAIDGRALSYPVTLLLDRPAQRDDAVTPPLHYAVLQLGFRTGPA